MRSSHAGTPPTRGDGSKGYNAPSGGTPNWGDHEDVELTPLQKGDSPGKFPKRGITDGNEASPRSVGGSLRNNSSSGNAEVGQRQTVQFLRVDESVRHLPDGAFNFSRAPTTPMTVSTATPMYGYTPNHLRILDDDVSPMFGDLLMDDEHAEHAGEGSYFRLESPTVGTPRACLEVKDNQEGDAAQDTHDVHCRVLGNPPSRRKAKGRRTLCSSFSKTASLLCNEVLSKSFQTMVSYVITTSFFIFLNLYVSNSCTYEEIGGFGVAVSVITLLSAVVDGVGSSLDYFCSCSIGMANTDLSLLYLNIAYYTFYLFFAKVLLVFFLAKGLFLLFVHYLYGGSGGGGGGMLDLLRILGTLLGGRQNCEHLQMVHVFCSSLQILLVSFFPQFIYESTRRYLILHNYIYPSLFTSVVSFIFLNLFGYLFVFSFDLKYIGACLSLLLTNVFNFCCVVYFLRIHLARCASSAGGVHQLQEGALLSGDHYVEVGGGAAIEEEGEADSEEDDEEEGEADSEEESGAECEEETLNGSLNGACDESLNRSSNGSHNNSRCATGEGPLHSLAFLFFHKPPDDDRKRDFIKTTRTNVRNIFFEILSFEFQLFEATYLSMTSVATFVQINNILNLVYYVSNSYGIVLSKLIGIYASSRGGGKQKRRNRRSGRIRRSKMDGHNRPSKVDGQNRPSKVDGQNRPSKMDGRNKPGGGRHNAAPRTAPHHPQKHTLCESKPLRNRSRIVITLLDIVLAFLLMLTFLSLCLVVVYLYRDEIIPFVFTDVNIQKKLKGIIFVFVLELFLEVLASLLNSIIKGLRLQEEITTFTLLNFVFCMHPLGLVLTFFLQLDIYGFVYSNLVSMAVQVAYLVVFLALRARGR
ncbi:multidrug efflux pump, putative [Plasmodium vivax]|uniref:Multidrug efflux pump, putative n=1 Tax=Plasmodium vivax TaxID=5855 RepID=A0A564ZRU6_PLAVI|nr:multidrug efflux pump, putative [Plasmodium vivax]